MLQNNDNGITFYFFFFPSEQFEMKKRNMYNNKLFAFGLISCALSVSFVLYAWKTLNKS